MAARSYLFVPGDRPDMLAKAATRGADALILDLEDAVAPRAKSAAREAIREHLAAVTSGGPERWIRVNNTPELLEADLALAARPGVEGVFLPKVNSARDVERAVSIVARAGRSEIPVGAMIETGRGILAGEAIAAVPQVRHLTLGLGDLGADLHIAGGPDDPMWSPIRMQMVVVSAANGLEPPIAPVSPDFADLDTYRSTTTIWARAGFGGRQVIHPAQVPVVNEAFSPTAEEVAEARRILTRFEAALDEGRGAIRDQDGTMLDEAFVRRARRIVDLAGPQDAG